MGMLRLMNQTGHQPPSRPIDAPASQVTSPHRLVYSGDPPKTRHHLVLYIAVSVAVLVILASLYIVSQSGAGNSSSSSGSNAQNSNDALPNPTQNPVNNGGSINSQIKYCSNDVNAALVC